MQINSKIIALYITSLGIVCGCKSAIQGSSLAVMSSNETQAIKQHCSSSKVALRRQVTVAIDADTKMIVYSPNICIDEKKRRTSLALEGKVARVPVLILRYGNAVDLASFKSIDSSLNKSGYEAIVIENKAGADLRSTLEGLKASRPDLLESDLRAIVQGHGAISSYDQQHVIGTGSTKNEELTKGATSGNVIKTAEDIIAPLQILTGPAKSCGVLVDSCYSGQVIHDVASPNKPNEFLSKVAVASGSSSSQTDYADDGTVLNAMLSMSRTDSPDRKGADANGDGGVSLEEASAYINAKGGVLHKGIIEAGQEPIIIQNDFGAVSWIDADKSGSNSETLFENRIKYNNESSRAEIEASDPSKVMQTFSSEAKPASQMFVGGDKTASEMVLFPLPVESDVNPAFKNPDAPVTDDPTADTPTVAQPLNPDQRE